MILQEEINQKTIAIFFKAEKITEDMLREAARAVAQAQKEQKAEKRAEQQARKNQPVQHRGKRTLRQLRADGEKLENVPLTEANIGVFDRYARKYEVDYALKRVVGMKPPQYYIFFKAKDEKTILLALKEFGQRKIKTKPSVKKQLHKAKQRSLPRRIRERTKRRERTDTR